MILTFILFIFKNGHFLSEPKEILAQNKACELKDIRLFLSQCREQKDSVKEKYPGRLNPANFGRFGHCYCICQKPGQRPCTAIVPHPEAKKPKFWQLKEDASAG